MRYLLFGASSSFGETDYENGGWANHLRKHLDTREKHRFFHNLAISGDNSKGVLARIENESKLRIRGKPKEEWAIFIAIGTNDSRLENKKPITPEDEYRENMIKILKKAKELAGTVFVIGGHPVIEKICNPWKQRDCYFLNERIKRYGQIMKECAEKENVPFIDVFSQLEKRDDYGSLTDDGLHPNKEGHLIIYSIVKEFLENIKY